MFHIACVLLRDTAYIQLRGYDESGNDNTNAVSYLILEAAHRLKAPANIGIAVADDIEEKLFRRGVEVILEDKLGYPKFLGMKNMVEGFVRSGYPIEAARQRVYAGCHWHAIPGREYPHMDMMKVNLPRVFEVAFQDMMADEEADKTASALWSKFALHLQQCVDCIKAGCDVHRAHMHEVFPELAIDLLCYGPVEKGVDASDDSLEYYGYGVDAAGLATVADSFGAIDQRVGREGRMTMGQLSAFLSDNWQNEGGEYGRRMMCSCPRFGQGGSAADGYAQRIVELFTTVVADRPTPGGIKLIPGVFGWASMIEMGKAVGATPNGRFAQEPISHGPNPSQGFRADGAPTALLKAVANVQPGRGNASPAQLDLDPTIAVGADAADILSGLVKAHFHDGGTQISLNVMDREQVLEAYENPGKYPELVVRVTGFSAYFASLSPQMRKFVVDRIVCQ
jgi:formate C-acetyltransferase